jgi:hypothetical protein
VTEKIQPQSVLQKAVWETSTISSRAAAHNRQKAQLILARLLFYGERGIRTLVKVTPKQHFQCCAFNRSAISPELI